MKLPLPSPGLPRVVVPVAASVLVIATGVLFGVEMALLVAAFFALLLVVGFAWVSVQSLTGDSPLTLDEALTLGQPSVEEEQKRAVLRALKDLDYERSVGKISDDDYLELSARYREEAKRLIERVDESLSPARERAEKLLAERVAREKAGAERIASEELARESEPRGDAKADGTDAPPSTGKRERTTDEEELA